MPWAGQPDASPSPHCTANAFCAVLLCPLPTSTHAPRSCTLTASRGSCATAATPPAAWIYCPWAPGCLFTSSYLFVRYLHMPMRTVYTCQCALMVAGVDGCNHPGLSVSTSWACTPLQAAPLSRLQTRATVRKPSACRTSWLQCKGMDAVHPTVLKLCPLPWRFNPAGLMTWTARDCVGCATDKGSGRPTAADTAIHCRPAAPGRPDRHGCLKRR